MAIDQERSFPRQDDLARLAPAIIVPLLVVGLVAFMLSRRRNGGAERASGSARRANQRGNRAMRRMVLSMVITVLENDMARRGAVAALKIARNRS